MHYVAGSNGERALTPQADVHAPLLITSITDTEGEKENISSSSSSLAQAGRLALGFNTDEKLPSMRQLGQSSDQDLISAESAVTGQIRRMRLGAGDKTVMESSVDFSQFGL